MIAGGGRERERGCVRQWSGVREESFILAAVAVAVRKKKAGSRGSSIIQKQRGWADGENHQIATEMDGGKL